MIASCSSLRIALCSQTLACPHSMHPKAVLLAPCWQLHAALLLAHALHLPKDSSRTHHIVTLSCHPS